MIEFSCLFAYEKRQVKINEFSFSNFNSPYMEGSGGKWKYQFSVESKNHTRRIGSQKKIRTLSVSGCWLGFSSPPFPPSFTLYPARFDIFGVGSTPLHPDRTGISLSLYLSLSLCLALSVSNTLCLSFNQLTDLILSNLGNARWCRRYNSLFRLLSFLGLQITDLIFVVFVAGS